jgi:hypothetical protein
VLLRLWGASKTQYQAPEASEHDDDDASSSTSSESEEFHEIPLADDAIPTLKPSHLNGTLTWWTLDMPGHPGSLHSTMSLCQYLFYLVWFLSCWCGDGYNWQGFWRLVSEVNALRTELLLPRDSANFVLLTMREPKSRFTYAKVDSHDLVAIVDLTFRELKPHNRLWPCSSQTLRSRFKSVLSALGLPTMSTLEQMSGHGQFTLRLCHIHHPHHRERWALPAQRQVGQLQNDGSLRAGMYGTAVHD